ncbi:MAG: adenosylcobalamin-dependent ribonucleoside-diphosphate reductase [Alistipes sp.]|nr:adenosylcobalamin-dependent ribonucleoside-diphosphate reductase [Alistipes sp.]MBO7265541.1 adenosylcobalamin-dependent ribonucleoside-diphosphate reductase [Alistipes sp.]
MTQKPKNEQISTVKYEDAVAASKEYFKGDDLAAQVWVSKYALKDSFGNIYEKSPEDMHNRIAKELARIERNYPNPLSEQDIFDLLDHFRYVIPQGGPMTGIGNNLQVASLSNCFVIGHKNPADSYGGIFRMDEEQVQLMKRRGGVGHDLSHIRPTGSPVLNSALTSTGIVPFMERYSNSTREVAQDGRRGALMLSLLIKHPDAERFIDAKVDTGKVTGANVSIKIDDEFMRAALAGESYRQQFPVDSKTPSFTQDIQAKKLWDKIIHNAWKSAEPGVLFWDTIIRESVPDCYAEDGFRTVSTNPCGEIPLCPYDSCRLLALNLLSYVENPFTDKAKFNFDLFKEHVAKAMHLMDDIIDLELEKVELIINKIASDPEDEDVRRVELELWKKIKDMALKGRRTGLGITAEGDMLAALGLRYGSEEAIDFAVAVHKTLAVEAYRASVMMAKDRGAFGVFNFEKEQGNPMVERVLEAAPELRELMKEYGRRNIAMLTIAPTGTTSLMSQTTSGIEPVFRPVYKRRRKINPSDKDQVASFVDETGEKFIEYYVFHHQFVKWLEINGYDTTNLQNISEEELDKMLQASPYYKATANDIDWVAKVKMQGAIQKWVDHSISVTVNLPNEVSEELVADVYRTAWESGCKGITVYRDGCRDGVLLDIKSKDNAKKSCGGSESIRRPESIPADIVRFKNGSEDWIAFVGKQDDRPYEIFTGKIEEDAMYIPKTIKSGNILKVSEKDGSKRYDFQYQDRYGYINTIGGISRLFDEEFWNYAKLISGVLRYGMPIDKVVQLVDGLHLDSETINTWKNGVERALKQYIKDGTRGKGRCPQCGQENMAYQNGCLTCMACGYSKCS